MTLLTYQEKELEKLFALQPELTPERVTRIADCLCLPEKNVQAWFIQRWILRNCLVVKEEIKNECIKYEDGVKEADTMDRKTCLYEDDLEKEDICPEKTVTVSPANLATCHEQLEKDFDNVKDWFFQRTTPSPCPAVKESIKSEGMKREDNYIPTSDRILNGVEKEKVELDILLPDDEENKDDFKKLKIFQHETVYGSSSRLRKYQQEQLEIEFQIDPHLTPYKIVELAHSLCLTEKFVHDWFIQRSTLPNNVAEKEKVKSDECIQREEDEEDDEEIQTIDNLCNKMKEEQIDSETDSLSDESSADDIEKINVYPEDTSYGSCTIH